MGYGDLLYLNTPGAEPAPTINPAESWTPAGGGQFYGGAAANPTSGSNYGAVYSSGLATWTPTVTTEEASSSTPVYYGAPVRVAAVPPKLTAVAPVKFVPIMLTT